MGRSLLLLAYIGGRITSYTCCRFMKSVCWLLVGVSFFLKKKNVEKVCDENRNLLRRGIGYVSMNKNKEGFLPKPV